MGSKYSNFLTILLVLIIIAIIGIIGFLGFQFYQDTVQKNNSEDFVDSFISSTNKDNNVEDNNSENTNDNTENGNFAEGIEGTTNSGSSSSSGNTQKYNGFTIAGTIEIPATNLKCPIISREEYSPSALETSVVEIYGVGLNQVGNTTISGHNYRNGRFFSNNKKLNIGDKIFITDLTGKRLTYTIYNKFEAEENYDDYIVRDTQGAIEISLSTCTDDTKARLIILAKADV